MCLERATDAIQPEPIWSNEPTPNASDRSWWSIESTDAHATTTATKPTTKRATAQSVDEPEVSVA